MEFNSSANSYGDAPRRRCSVAAAAAASGPSVGVCLGLVRLALLEADDDHPEGTSDPDGAIEFGKLVEVAGDTVNGAVRHVAKFLGVHHSGLTGWAISLSNRRPRRRAAPGAARAAPLPHGSGRSSG